MLTQHTLVHAVPWVSSVGLSLEGLCNGGSLYSCSGSLRMISATGGRGECKNACFPNTRAWGPHFLLDRAAQRAPMPASTGWSRTRGSTRRHSYPRAGRLVTDCRHCPSTVLGSRSPTIACPPRAANCRRASCVRPVFSVTRSTRGVSESDIRRTSSHHLRVEVDLYSAVLSSRHSVENPEGCMALDSESSHGACFCTRKHATSTHSAWALSLAVMYRSFPEVDNEREVPKVSLKHAFIDEETSSINCKSSDARF